MRLYKTKLQEKLEEAFKAVLPVVGIVLALCFSVAPVSPGILMEFLVGGFLLIIGMMFFTLGAELSMTSMGERVGSGMTRSRKLWLMVVLGFILWYVIPGYGLALALTFVAPRIFTAIAFDSGGVASGPMTAAFLLPFAMGACQAVGGNPVRDAFGVVAMVAMTPLITIQALGLIYQLGARRTAAAGVSPRAPQGLDLYGDYDIIEL